MGPGDVNGETAGAGRAETVLVAGRTDGNRGDGEEGWKRGAGKRGVEREPGEGRKGACGNVKRSAGIGLRGPHGVNLRDIPNNLYIKNCIWQERAKGRGTTSAEDGSWQGRMTAGIRGLPPPRPGPGIG